MMHGEHMTINSLLRCVVMYCLTRGDTILCDGDQGVVHIAWCGSWSGCITGNPGEAGSPAS